MKYPLVILLLLFFVISFYGCPGNNPVDESSADFQLIGTVLDTQHQPVRNADIHYFFGASKNNAYSKRAADPMPSTRIGFSLPAKGKVVINILQFGSRKFLRNLVDTTYDAGNYSIGIDSGWLTNGFYIYQISIDGIVTEKIMVQVIFDMDQLRRTEPLTRTGSDGTFSLSKAALGIGQRMYMTSETNQTIIDSTAVDSIAIVIFKDDKSLIEGFTINATQTETRTFVLK